MSKSQGIGTDQDWPYVRTRIPPAARDRAKKIAGELGWSMPGVYTAAMCWFLMGKTPKQAISLINRHLDGTTRSTEQDGE